MRQGWLFSAALGWLMVPAGVAGALPLGQSPSVRPEPQTVVQFNCGSGKTKEECAGELLQRRADEFKAKGLLPGDKTQSPTQARPQARPSAPAPTMQKSKPRPAPSPTGRVTNDRDGRPARHGDVRQDDRVISRDRDRNGRDMRDRDRDGREVRDRDDRNSRDRDVRRSDRDRGHAARPDDRRGGSEYRGSAGSGYAGSRTNHQNADRGSSRDRSSVHDRRDDRKDRKHRRDRDSRDWRD
jgi:hypothetical protein